MASKKPVRLMRSGLTGSFYAVTAYREDKDGLIVASTKHDVTQDFYRAAAEEWPHLVEQGHLKARAKEPEPIGDRPATSPVSAGDRAPETDWP